MPSVTGTTVSADTWSLRFRALDGDVDQFNWIASGSNLVAYAGQVSFVRLLTDDLSAARTLLSFSFTIGGGGTYATLDFEWSEGTTAQIRLTPHANWIACRVMALARIDPTDVLVVQLVSENYTIPQRMLASDGMTYNWLLSSLISYTATGGLAWGLVPDNQRWFPSASGPMRLLLGYRGSMADDADATDRECGLYLCSVSDINARLDSILAGMSGVSDKLAARQYHNKARNMYFCSDASTAWGGGATPGTALGNTIAATAKALGADAVVLQEYLWRDDDNKFMPLAGAADMVTAILAQNLDVALHVNPFMWRTTASGAGSYNHTTYDGQRVDMTAGYTGFTRFKHWQDGTTEPTAIEEDIPVAMKAGYDAIGANLGWYLDSLECVDYTDVDNSATGVGWYYEQWIILNILAQHSVPIWGMSGTCGIDYLLRTRHGTLDILADVEGFTDAQAYNDASWVKRIGLATDFGWVRVKPSDYITTEQLQYAVTRARFYYGGWTIQGTTTDLVFATALAGGLDTRGTRGPITIRGRSSGSAGRSTGGSRRRRRRRGLLRRR